MLQSALVSAAETHLGTTKRRQSDWFVDSRDVLSPLLEERRRCYNNWVRSGSPTDHALFKAVWSRARAAFRQVRAQWLEHLAAQAESGRTSRHGKSVWHAIKAIQRSHQGLWPTPTPAIRDENGALCTSLADQCQQWRRHFQGTLVGFPLVIM